MVAWIQEAAMEEVLGMKYILGEVTAVRLLITQHTPCKEM